MICVWLPIGFNPGVKPCLLPTSSNPVADELRRENGTGVTELAA